MRVPIVGVLVLLAAVGTATALWAQQRRHLLACEHAGDDIAAVGVYGFFLDAGRILCLAPSNDADGTDVPCLRVGGLHVGQSREDVEKDVGRPWRDLDARFPEFSTSAYLVFHDSTSNTGAYYVIEYERLNGREIAFSVQLTGSRPDTVHHFSCLHLEDGEAAVRRQLGEPSGVSAFEAVESGVSGVVWSYDPLPLSIELVDGKVYSFRVWRPDYVEPKERKLSLLEKR